MKRLVVALLLLVPWLAGCSVPPKQVPEIKTVGVQLFQWPWRSIAQECTDVLGPAGVAWVLTSPPQEHITGEAWWTSYQPVSYQLESKLGTRDEFADMVKTCDEAGVEIIADAVVNHMAGIDGGTGFAGTQFSHYSYPGLYEENDFHHCGLAAEDDIANYLDAEQVQTCELVNLADLDTSSEEVQEKLAAYLSDLQSLGVAGFRIDAAKHMAAEDVADILKQLPESTKIISEVIRGSGEPIQPEEYLDFGGVFAFQFARDLKGAVAGGSYSLALDLGDGQVPSDRAYTFVTNHDTERNSQTLSYRDGTDFELATALMMGAPYGNPTLYSGYAFAGHDDGAPSEATGKVSMVECPEDLNAEVLDGQWTCGHRSPVGLGLVRWRNVVQDAPVANLWDDGEALAFDRGELGLMALSGEDEPKKVKLTTGLPDGRYCDAVSAAATGKTECDSGKYVVSGGSVEFTLEPGSVVALHVNLRSA